jgi:hypothetical protein
VVPFGRAAPVSYDRRRDLWPSNLNKDGSVALILINSARRSTEMGSTSDKASGIGNQAAGKIKQGVGRATGNDRLAASVINKKL